MAEGERLFRRATMTRPELHIVGKYQAPCQHWIGAEKRHCGVESTRRYMCGSRCQQHTPSALAGKPEPVPPPRRPPRPIHDWVKVWRCTNWRTVNWGDE